MKKYMRVAILVLWTLAAAASAGATGPTSWIDVVGTFGADPTCTADSGPAINNAIAAATQPGGVLFFQTGCYLIKTEIVDLNPVSGLTYLGYGNVTLQAYPFPSATNDLPAILQLGDATHPITGRRISNITFQCNPTGIAGRSFCLNGISVFSLSNSLFEDVQILNYAVNGLQTFAGSTLHNTGNLFRAGTINSAVPNLNSGGGCSTTCDGVSLAPGSDNWTFVGTTLGFGTNGGTQGFSAGSIGIDVEANGFTCVNCNVQGWTFGIAAALGSPVQGFEISGGTYAGNSNSGAAIRIGAPGDPHRKAYGVSIHGATIGTDGIVVGNTPYCIDLEQASGFSITGNTFSCVATEVRAFADDNTPGQVTGADNGLVGPNDDSGRYLLQGQNITFRRQACTSSSSPASCSTAASSGIVAISAGTFTLTVNDPFVSATSRIVVSEDMTLGAQLGVTCNTVGGRTYSVTSKVAQTSFTVTASSAPAGNPACLTFHIEN